MTLVNLVDPRGVEPRDPSVNLGCRDRHRAHWFDYSKSDLKKI